MPHTDSAGSAQHSSANPGPVDPALSALDKRIGNLIVNRFTYRALRILGRLARPTFEPTKVTIEQTARAVIVTPYLRSGSGALMLFHGGGFVLGEPADLIPKASIFAQALGVPVICPTYRLAPQSPYPAAIDDAFVAWQTAITGAAGMDLGGDLDPTKIVLGGYSAGAGLAASLAHRLHDHGGIQPAAQMLVYPMLDDRTAERHALDAPRHRVWSNRNNRFAWSAYLGPGGGADSMPYAAAARRTDLSGLPPVWLGVGTCDLFLDEVREYRACLKAANVEVTYEEVAGAIHGFDMDHNPLGQRFTEAQLAFVRRFVS